MNSNLQNLAKNSQAWPFQEAQLILKNINNTVPDKGYVLFETGYGPSGLPHIGTFGEVARTTMVMNAFNTISDIKTRLFTFSDDLDGLRKIPDNVPNKEMLMTHLGKPLTSIPDPFGTHESYGHHMNARLKSFLDQFGFHYEFHSATACYQSGIFDQTLIQVLKYYDKIMQVMLPTLGQERQATYSPFLPICPETGIVLQVPIINYDLNNNTITYKNANNEEVTTIVTGGKCKLQWKVDWAMRWCALDVDYEMHGKDLIPSAALSTKICQIMGKKAPILLNYELFLDEKGQKISKSKGNGISMEQWLNYAPTESLSLYMYQSPKKAKRLFFDVIPKQVDEYLIYLNKFITEDTEKRLNNPVWHIHQGIPPLHDTGGINFSLLLNLASACNPEDKSVLWGFITKYNPNTSPEKNSFLDKMADYTIKYYNDFIKPNKQYKTPSPEEINILKDLIKILGDLPIDTSEEEIQNQIYIISKNHQIKDLRAYFQSLYEILLGQSQGPRIGTFIKFYGIDATIKLIKNKINN